MIVAFACFGWALSGHHMVGAYALTRAMGVGLSFLVLRVRSRTGWWDVIRR